MMKYLLVLALLLFTGTDKLTRIAKTNELKKLAKEAFEKGNYESAIKNYEILVDSFDISDDNIMLNLGNAYYQTNDTIKALDSYKSIIAGENKSAKSLAYQQLGVISGKENELKQALDFFKEALRNNPLNEEARYNYELTKKKLKELDQQNQENQDQQDQNQENEENKEDQQNKDQQNQDQNQQDENGENKEGEQNEQEQKQEEGEQNQDQQNQEGEGEESKKEQQPQPQNEEGEEQEEREQAEQQEGEEGDNGEEKATPQSIEQKLQEMNLTPEKAKMILEAMRNGEVQYIQQNKRKPTKRKDSSKPDW
ncbi:MAG: hypothetical protein AAF363_15835 [Bacteroidota bacterium]